MATTTGMADTGLLLARAGGPIAHDLAKRLTRVAREKVSARDVHRLRSGSRRLAALFHHLPGPGGSARRRRVRSMIRLLRRRAGKVRDCDVSLEIVERELPAGDASREIRRRLRRRRDRAARKLVEASALLLSRELPARLIAAVGKKTIPQSRAHAALERCRRRVVALARRVVDKPDHADRLHKLRLAVKGHRDTAAFLVGVVPGAAPAADRAKALADLLGKAQDLAVLSDLLTRVARRARGDAREGIVMLQRRLNRRLKTAQRHAASALGGAGGA